MKGLVTGSGGSLSHVQSSMCLLPWMLSVPLTQHLPRLSGPRSLMAKCEPHFRKVCGPNDRRFRRGKV